VLTVCIDHHFVCIIITSINHHYHKHRIHHHLWLLSLSWSSLSCINYLSWSSLSLSWPPLSVITTIINHRNHHHRHHYHQLGWSSSVSYFFLYWMPIPIEFGSFLLLPLYFAHVLYPEEIKSCWNYLRIGYIVVIFGLLSCQAIYILLSLLYNVSYRYYHHHHSISSSSSLSLS
jgi:hypothetical protein